MEETKHSARGGAGEGGGVSGGDKRKLPNCERNSEMLEGENCKRGSRNHILCTAKNFGHLISHRRYYF